MDIKPIGFKAYQKGLPVGHEAAKVASSSASIKKQDTISISAKATSRQGIAADSVSRSLSSAASPDRLNQLRAAVSSGTYTVDSAQLASCILDGRV